MSGRPVRAGLFSCLSCKKSVGRLFQVPEGLEDNETWHFSARCECGFLSGWWGPVRDGCMAVDEDPVWPGRKTK